MKTANLMKLILLLGIILFIQNDTQASEFDKNKLFIRLNTPITNNILSELSNYGEIIDKRKENIIVKNLNKDNQRILINWVVLAINKDNLEQIKDLNYVDFISYFTQSEKNSTSLGITGLIYVKLKQNIDISDFEKDFNVEVVDIIGYKKNILKILVNKNLEEPIYSLESRIKQKEYSSWVQVGYLYNSKPQCNNDPLFGNQWGLNNTGQNNGATGVDIKHCAAMTITEGSPNITVAVVDEGVDLTHPDLQANIVGGFDATGNNGNGAPTNNDEVHGTACAGIIAAIKNNIGITGVAPNCKIMSCKMSFKMAQTDEWLADCIDFAWQNGADVINNSWGGSVNNQNMNTAINNALTLGRDGLGCVVVFASGNQGSIWYPANTLPEILVVGGVDRCGIRSGRQLYVNNSCDPWSVGNWKASGRGEELDVAAPGTNIYTTTIQGEGNINNDYRSDFSGTSAAAPHVSGIAALILSINPCLTEGEVKDRIERTAQKVGGYDYTIPIDSPRPNGSWNNKTGYGLVDAYQALMHTDVLFLQRKFESGGIGINYENVGSIRTGSAVTSFVPNGEYWIFPSSDIELKATSKIKLENGTKIFIGANFKAYIDDFNGNCSDWILPRIIPNNHPTDDNIVVKDKSKKSTENITNKIDFSVYPNPFENNFNLTINLNQKENYNLSVFNSSGQLIFSQNGEFAFGEQSLNIPIKESNGLYIIQLRVGDKIITKKLMKYE